jgi:hypothetical protein
VERLAAVPPTEPATGFDLAPAQEEATALFEPERAEVAPEWPPVQPAGRGRLPHSRARRNEKPDRRRPDVEGPIWTAPVMPDHPMPDLTWSGPSTDDDEPLSWRRRALRRPARTESRGERSRTAASTEVIPAVGDDPRTPPPVERAPHVGVPGPVDGPGRPEVRDRPRPRPRPRPATVYVSRHAADPQQEPRAQ